MKTFETLIINSAWLSAILFGMAGIMLTYEVGARYLFIAPTIWAAELSQLSLIFGKNQEKFQIRITQHKRKKLLV